MVVSPVTPPLPPHSPSHYTTPPTTHPLPPHTPSDRTTPPTTEPLPPHCPTHLLVHLNSSTQLSQSQCGFDKVEGERRQVALGNFQCSFIDAYETTNRQSGYCTRVRAYTPSTAHTLFGRVHPMKVPRSFYKLPEQLILLVR